MTLTKAERIHITESIPWVKVVKRDIPCDGIRWNKVPLKALYDHGGKPATGLDKYRCKNKAKWSFRALKRPQFPARDGNYCWSHLHSSGLFYNNEETQRFERWYQKWREVT